MTTDGSVAAPRTGGDPDLVALTRRIARSVQTTIGWIFWDPGAVTHYETLGLPGPLGYIAARAGPLGPAGPDAIVAAFGSISPAAITAACDLVAERTSFAAVHAARDAAVLAGLAEHAPAICAPLAEFGPELWSVVERLPRAGRVLFAAHAARPRPTDPVLAGWHAVNCLREWRGDTHWALVVAAGLSGPDASVLHNEWLGYEPDWLPRSRGSTPDEIAAARAALRARGLIDEHGATHAGRALRQRIEDDTDRLTVTPWALLGAERTLALAEALEPPCELLLARVDLTAGPNYQPASRIRD
ncbi:MAG: SCO6745 family protein [Actinomycetota bacterium]